MVGPAKIIIGVSGTTIAWLITAFVSKPTDEKTLREFCRLINPSGPGWKDVFEKAESDGETIMPQHAQDNLPMGIICTIIGSISVYGALFATGYWIYREPLPASILTAVSVGCAIALIILWGKITSGRATTESS